MVLILVLAWQSGDTTALVRACGLLFTMILLWLGVGNVLSVVSPLRDEPLAARRNDGTLKPFLISWIVSYGVGYLVNLMLYWRVRAKQTAIERLGGVGLPVLLTIGSALVTWVLLTIAAVTMAQAPRYRRQLRRELVDPPAMAGHQPTAKQ